MSKTVQVTTKRSIFGWIIGQLIQGINSFHIEYIYYFLREDYKLYRDVEDLENWIHTHDDHFDRGALEGEQKKQHKEILKETLRLCAWAQRHIDAQIGALQGIVMEAKYNTKFSDIGRSVFNMTNLAYVGLMGSTMFFPALNTLLIPLITLTTLSSGSSIVETFQRWWNQEKLEKGTAIQKSIGQYVNQAHYDILWSSHRHVTDPPSMFRIVQTPIMYRFKPFMDKYGYYNIHTQRLFFMTSQIGYYMPRQKIITYSFPRSIGKRDLFQPFTTGQQVYQMKIRFSATPSHPTQPKDTTFYLYWRISDTPQNSADRRIQKERNTVWNWIISTVSSRTSQSKMFYNEMKISYKKHKNAPSPRSVSVKYQNSYFTRLFLFYALRSVYILFSQDKNINIDFLNNWIEEHKKTLPTRVFELFRSIMEYIIEQCSQRKKIMCREAQVEMYPMVSWCGKYYTLMSQRYLDQYYHQRQKNSWNALWIPLDTYELPLDIDVNTPPPSLFQYSFQKNEYYYKLMENEILDNKTLFFRALWEVLTNFKFILHYISQKLGYSNPFTLVVYFLVTMGGYWGFQTLRQFIPSFTKIYKIKRGSPSVMQKVQHAKHLLQKKISAQNIQAFIESARDLWTTEYSILLISRTPWKKSHMYDLVDLFYQNFSIKNVKELQTEPPDYIYSIQINMDENIAVSDIPYVRRKILSFIQPFLAPQQTVKVQKNHSIQFVVPLKPLARIRSGSGSSPSPILSPQTSP